MILVPASSSSSSAGGKPTGWGTADINGFTGSSELPAFVLGHRFWSHAWILVLIALFNSALAVAIATTNAATRIFFGMARSGALPGAADTGASEVPHADRRDRVPDDRERGARALCLPLLIGVAQRLQPDRHVVRPSP